MLSDTMLMNEMDGLRKFAFKLCKSQSDADDLVQSTILRALQNRDKFDDEGRAFGWLSKIMFNLFVTGYKRKTRFESQYDPEPVLMSMAVSSAQEDHVMVQEVKAALTKMNPQHKEILMLACVYEMTYDEISMALKIPLGTVRSRLSRAREALLGIIDDEVDQSYYTNDNASYVANQNTHRLYA